MDRLQQISAAVMIAGLCGIAAARQTSSPQNPSTTPATSTTHPQAKPSAAKPANTTTTRPAVQTVQRIPIETAPPTPPSAKTAAQEAQQKAADERLLEQQQAQSAAAAQVTNQIVQTAQKQQDKIQNEIRIQDAPGPAQTGVVPAAGPPTLPAANKSQDIQDIQDAPGPAQTLAPAQPQPVAAPVPPPPTWFP